MLGHEETRAPRCLVVLVCQKQGLLISAIRLKDALVCLVFSCAGLFKNVALLIIIVCRVFIPEIIGEALIGHPEGPRTEQLDLLRSLEEILALFDLLHV